MTGQLTPMMKQYFDIKENYRDCLLFYRLGDFYELFFEDAQIASAELDLVLTGRDCGLENRAPMCGVPYHSSDGYIAKLIKKGYKIAICEQTEDPALAKGLVRREIVRIITPGTVMDTSVLDEKSNNYICAAYADASGAGVCFADITTGEVYATEIAERDYTLRLVNEIGRFSPKEALLDAAVIENKTIAGYFRQKSDCKTETGAPWRFAYQDAAARVLRQFKSESMTALGLEQAEHAICAAGALLSYISETQMCDMANLGNLRFYTKSMFMELDVNTFRNLELCETLRTKEKRGSLLYELDRTKTAMGSRMLRSYIEKPLLNVAAITRRHQAVGEFLADTVNRGELTHALRGLYDMERMMGRIVYGTANARDLRALAQTAAAVPKIRRLLSTCKSPLIEEITADMDELADIRDLINSSIIEDPPFSVREGGLVRDGFNPEIDRLRGIMTGGKDIIAAIEAKEREKTGIKGLKISYNRVFGYYIEITKSYYDMVPAEYIRKQTLANCERFITEELKAAESDVVGAQDKLHALEYDVFCETRNYAGSQVHRVQRTARSLAAADVLLAFAETAAANRYVCPKIDLADRISITDGRHPVVENMLGDSVFVPNDTNLDGAKNRVAILTGPNMAGKSTYMRQVAIITLMAQIGSFVPARSAEIGIVDRIFTRVGASDDLAGGMSTFMVEMSEVADIIKYATKKSLVIYDEIGRGTSTFDGMAIARAVLEYTADVKKLGAKTLFATHYHELTVLENELDGVVNYNVSVKKRGDEITFLRKIVRGGADESYGVEVARLAGVPKAVIERAKQILRSLEAGEAQRAVIPAAADGREEISLFDSGKNEILAKISALDINTFTPIEALNLLNKLIQETKSIQTE